MKMKENGSGHSPVCILSDLDPSRLLKVLTLEISGGTVKPTYVAMEKTRQSIQGPEEDCDVISSDILAEPRRLQTGDVRTDSDMTMGAENAGDSSRRSGIAVQHSDGLIKHCDLLFH